MEEQPIVEDGMTEEPMMEEQPVEDEGIDDVTLEMAANIAEELDKEEEPEPDLRDELRTVYEECAAKVPLVEEVIQGLTTFREALEEIITDMYQVGDESSLREFAQYHETVTALLRDAPVLELNEKQELYRFSILHSEKASKKFRRDQIMFGGGSAVAWGAGEYLVRQPRHVQAGLILKALGMGGVGGTALVELKYGLRGYKLGKKVSAVREVLYKTADMLDKEVKELFGKQDS